MAITTRTELYPDPRSAWGNGTSANLAEDSAPGQKCSHWQARYGDKFRPQRVTTFPEGVLPPKKVRIYRRDRHFLLQWWNPKEKQTISERVDGDLIEAISRARRIDDRLINFRASGVHRPPRTARELVELYQADLSRRADAGEIDVATVGRYAAASHRLVDFAELPTIERRYPDAGKVDREFQLRFSAYLNDLIVIGGGSGSSNRGSLKATRYILAVARGVYDWAADPNRGHLLAEGFRNPFSDMGRPANVVAPDPFRSVDITVPMAVELIRAADYFQLQVLTPIMLYGLRPAELGWIFIEHLKEDWLKVPCIPELEYTTKGRRNKQFPIPEFLRRLWQGNVSRRLGLLYEHRRASICSHRLPLLGCSLTQLIEEFKLRCATIQARSAAERRTVRNAVLRDAGQLNYDRVQDEFQKLAVGLDWPSAATLKDLRHLCATCLEDAGVPEFYRRYFMGHSLGRAPIATYTHLSESKMQQYFKKALQTEFAPIVGAIEDRLKPNDYS